MLTRINKFKGAVRSSLALSLLVAATLTAPVAQAAVPMSFGPVMNDLLINRPDTSPNDMSGMIWSVRGEGRLLRESLRTYRCVGHQAGRYINNRHGLPDIGDGPCRRFGPLRY